MKIVKVQYNQNINIYHSISTLTLHSIPQEIYAERYVYTYDADFKLRIRKARH